MKYSKFINFKAISEELTGQSQKIRQTNTASKYVDILNNLDDYLDIWLKQSKKQLQPRTKNKNKVNKNILQNSN